LTLARVLNTSVEQLFPKPLAPVESPGADLPAAPPAAGVDCDALPQPERAWFDIPVTETGDPAWNAAWTAYYDRFHGFMSGGDNSPDERARTANVFLSQSTWDSTMGASAANALAAGAPKVVLCAGCFHIERSGGTVLQFLARRPGGLDSAGPPDAVWLDADALQVVARGLPWLLHATPHGDPVRARVLELLDEARAALASPHHCVQVGGVYSYDEKGMAQVRALYDAFPAPERRIGGDDDDPIFGKDDGHVAMWRHGRWIEASMRPAHGVDGPRVRVHPLPADLSASLHVPRSRSRSRSRCRRSRRQMRR
jgi:hypothetical protein